MRSPLVAADFLVNFLAAVTAGDGIRKYAEVGTRDGDNIACVTQLARSRGLSVRAAAVEQSPRRCEALRFRAAAASKHGDGFDVIETQVNTSTYLRAIPTADVYYYWGIAATNFQMVRWIDESSRARGNAGIAFLGFDWHYPADRQAMVPTLLAFRAAKGNTSARVHRLFFDESKGHEDVEPSQDESDTNGATMDELSARRHVSTSERARPPTYTRPFAKRPGQWGVFHVVSVRVGVGTRPLPPVSE